MGYNSDGLAYTDYSIRDFYTTKFDPLVVANSPSSFCTTDMALITLNKDPAFLTISSFDTASNYGSAV